MVVISCIDGILENIIKGKLLGNTEFLDGFFDLLCCELRLYGEGVIVVMGNGYLII
jgi:hypothetical protein